MSETKHQTKTKTATEADILPGTEITEYKKIANEIIAYEKADSDQKKTIDQLISK